MVNPPSNWFMQHMSESYLADIGRTAVAWSFLEGQFELLYRQLLILDDKNAAPSFAETTNGNDERFEQRVIAIRTIVGRSKMSNKVKGTLDRLLGQLERLREECGDIIHQPSHSHMDERTMLCRSALPAFPAGQKRELANAMSKDRPPDPIEVCLKIQHLYQELLFLLLEPPWFDWHRDAKLGDN